MDVKKAKRFNEKMSRAKHFPRHQNLSKGGMVDRSHFADGGTTVASNNGADVNGNTEQGGLFGNLTQQSEYNAKLAPTTQFNYAPTVGAASVGALNNAPVNQAIDAERALAAQYGDVAAGRGPNPALAALNQQTGTNIANTAALQAGQRGGSANVGLLARQVGQQGAATQQNAVGQAATVQANQQLGALGAQAGLQNQIANQGLGEQGVLANLYGTAAGANTGQNNTNVGNYAMAQGLNQATAAANTAATGQTQGGIIGGIGSALSAIPFLHEGGEVKKMAAGGPALATDLSLPGVVQPIAPITGPALGVAALPGAPIAAAAPGPLGVDTSLPVPEAPQVGGTSVGSYVGDILKGEKDGKDKDADPTGFKSIGKSLGSLAMLAQGGRVHPGPHASHVANYLFAEGGPVAGKKVEALVSPQEVYLNPHQVTEVVERGADPMRIGHHFPGSDKVKKNSQKNDVIPVELEDGGVVLPISVTTHRHASDKGRKFVEKAHAKRHMKKPKGI